MEYEPCMPQANRIPSFFFNIIKRFPLLFVDTWRLVIVVHLQKEFY